MTAIKERAAATDSHRHGFLSMVRMILLLKVK
jgi:hypothetical protein